MVSSTLNLSNNISVYNSTRDFLINYHGYTYQQLFGKKQWFLDELEQGNPQAIYQVTKRKRDWIRWQFDRFVDYFDLYEG